MLRFDESGMVTCNVCGQSFKQITVSHLSKHGMTMKQYRIEYDIRAFAPIVSSTRNKKIKITRA